MENENQLNLLLEVINVIVVNTEEQKQQQILVNNQNEQILQQILQANKSIVVVYGNLKQIADTLMKITQKHTAQNNDLLNQSKQIVNQLTNKQKELISYHSNKYEEVLEQQQKIFLLQLIQILLLVILIIALVIYLL